MAKFSFHSSRPKKKEEEEPDIDEKLPKWDAVDKIRKLDENNPMERAIKFDNVRKNPPQRDYMKVDLYEKNGELSSVSHGFDGTSPVKVLDEDRFFSVDLNTCIMADVAACPSNIISMLIDQWVNVAINEKKTFKPEKRKDEFNWWWLVLGLCMVPGIVVMVLMFLSGGG